MQSLNNNRLKSGLIAYLDQYITDHKREYIERVLSQRTRHITVVLEDIYQSQNASAVLRTCECLGVQDVHVIENTTSYSINKRVVMGSTKWLNIHRHKSKNANNTLKCYERLKSSGYTIVATSPEGKSTSLFDLPIDNKIAFVFGNELHGLSGGAITNADLTCHVPMFGFTESFNISVTAAICIHYTLSVMRNSKVAWQLSEGEKEDIRLDWLRKTVHRSELLEKRYLESIK